MCIEKFLNQYGNILKKCEKPSRYIGGEFLCAARNFDDAKVAFLLAFPDKYEIGISNFGHKILYNILNNSKYFLADRLYAPDKDFLELLTMTGKKLYSLELKKPVKNFDFVGFALQYELSYTTILKLLEMSDIPVFSKDRDDEHPIITAGGPCAFNPCALSDFIDLFFIGDGEEMIIDVCQKYNEVKHLGREKAIEELSKIEGVYSPKYSVSVKKRTCELKREYAPVKSPIPHFTSIHDRATVEIRRGCARLCRFCQSAHTNLPIRERDKDEIVSLVKEYVKNTGYDEYSLLSLSSNDHTQIENIIEELNTYFKESGVSVSLPSQRADNFSIRLAKLMQEGKKSSVTIAPEAGSKRMRSVINKNLTQEQIVNAVLTSVKEGWNRVKLYFMIGLPTESCDDLYGIIRLLIDINTTIKKEGLKLPNIVCSVSILVPKPFTPFQWCAQDSLDTIYEKIRYLKNSVKDLRELKNVKLNYHDPKISQIEALFARADRTLGAFIYKLYQNGSYMDSWDENFDHGRYLECAQALGIDIEDKTTKKLELNTALPWDFIDCGIKKEYFIKGYEEALGSLGMTC